ncbi:hypothetical protein ACFT7S_17820 [Streptomyces sp. NPDC057136]
MTGLETGHDALLRLIGERDSGVLATLERDGRPEAPLTLHIEHMYGRLRP